MLDYEDYEIEKCGLVKIDNIPDYEKIVDFIEGLIEGMYKTGNILMVEHCIEELAFLYGVEYKFKKPKLKKKETPCI